MNSYHEGEIVPRTFTTGYIVLSYIVSYVGALTTLELIHRRTADTGLYNWYVPHKHPAENVQLGSMARESMGKCLILPT